MKYALALAAVCVASSPGLAQDVKCSGTEPFWDLTINDRQIRFSSPENSFDMTPVQPSAARGMAQDYVLVYRTRASTDRNAPVTIVLQKSPSSQCSDGMSDTSHPYYAVVVTPRAVFAGCCRTD
jgi:uncharacterized membrane protein